MSTNPGNKREVLEAAQYSVRYLTMTSKQFKVASGLLTKEEEDSMLYNFLHMRSVLAKSIQEYQDTMTTPRHRIGGLWKHVWRPKAHWLKKSVSLLSVFLTNYKFLYNSNMNPNIKLL